MHRKVCHVTTVHGSWDNRIYHKECKTLASMGYDVTLIAPHGKDEFVGGVQILNIRREVSRLKRMFWVSPVLAFFKAMQVKAELYHFHDPELMPMGVLLRLCGKKVVYDVHENTAGSILTKPYMPFVMRKYVSGLIHFLEHTVSRCYSAMVVARPDIGENFKDQKCTVVRNFPILSVAEGEGGLPIEKSKKAVVYVGGMTRIRGTKQLVDAFENIPDAELWLVGSFSEADLKEECIVSPGWKNVRYLGNVQPYQVFQIVRQADIGIITFLPAPNHLTTLATKPFEYMACGLPMIMSDFEYWRYTFGDLSDYVDPADSKSISVTVNNMLKDPERMKHMGEAGKARVYSEFNWELESLHLKELYRDLVGV